MDYTLFRRELIYKKRTSLEEFADEHEEITFLIDNMLDSYYFSSADGKDRALRCFNTAYYICTLIRLCDQRPEWYFGRYCDIAYCGAKDNKVYQSFTLSLVYIFLTHTYYKLQCDKLLEKLEKFFDRLGNALIWNDPFLKDYTYRDVCHDLLKDSPDNFLISEEFLPRKIDRDIFREVDGPGDIWSKLTNLYERHEVRKVVDALGKDEEEKHVLIDLISRDAHRFYSTNGGYYHETVKPMLDEIDEDIYYKYNDEVNRAIAEAEMEELKYQGDIRPLQARIVELEKELEAEKAKNEMVDKGVVKKTHKNANTNNQKDIRESQVDTGKEIDDEEDIVEEGVLHNKVSFELFLRLLEKAGFDINNTGNKTRAGNMWHMMTGKSADDLRKFCSTRKYSNNHTKEDIKQVNSQLTNMGISDIQL